MNNIKGFKPDVGNAPRILILGTMPGEKSLQKQEECNKQKINDGMAYYANPSNRFWKIIEIVVNNGEPLESDSKKRECLHNNGIALWDVLASCNRVKSADKNIEKSLSNSCDFANFLNIYPTISHIIFNGKKAKRYFDQHNFLNKVERKITLTVVPSSSGNNRNNRWKDTTTGDVIILKGETDKIALWKKALDNALREEK